MGRVAFEHVSKRFDDVIAVDDLTLEIADKEFLVLLGPSGCGKSTALRMVAGLEDPTSGTITIGDRVVNDVEARDRDVAMVFQSYALYPHMTVSRNIEFPLRSRKVPADERDQLVRDAAETLGLEELLDRKPRQLSGGQRQRVALARAIVRRPEAFLMDEPLSNLDAKLRVQTRAELVELQRRLEATVVYVTHDQVEAMTMGDRIAIMQRGVLQQVGAPQDVYARPGNLFVAGFIGSPPMNTVTGRVTHDGDTFGRGAPRRARALSDDVARAVAAMNLEEVVIGVRPEDLRFESGEVGVVATVSVVESLGHERHIACRLTDGQLVIVRQDRARRRAERGRERASGRRRPAPLRSDDRRADRRVTAPPVTVEPPAVTPGLSPARRARRRRERALGFGLLVPALIVFGAFIFFPLFKNVYLGFFKNPPFPGLPKRYVGFDQYQDVLTSRDFLESLKTTVLFALMTVPVGIALGLGLAVVAHQQLKGIGIYRTIFSSTVATSVAVAAVIFGTLLNPQVGLLPWLGLTTDPAVLQNPSWALVAVAVTTVWQTLGLTFILMSAGLQSVPDDLLEAARVDGAGAWSRFWHVTLPMMSPTIFFAVVIGSIFAFQTFGQIDLLTQGGPLKKTNVLTYFIYKALHDQSDPGKAAVLAVALFLITMALALLQIRLLERRVSYDR